MGTNINTDEMFRKIKNQNGEGFAKKLRDHVLLDVPNLEHVLEYAGKNPDDAENLVDILTEIRDTSKKSKKTENKEKIKDPLELLNEAGYDAFYVKNLRQQNSIEKYFEPDEKLCTFSDPTRYQNYYIIHAVKKNVKNIKRSKHPDRQDEYGTSVISIQIAKPNGGFISIKNRYNHTVNNPDATFDNNPDNIITGLTEALKHKFGVDFFAQNATLPDNYRIINDQLVRFNYEMLNVYYDEKYYFEGSTITKLNSDYEVMLDGVILNTKTGRCEIRSDNLYLYDLARVLNNEIHGHKVERKRDKKTGETVINIIDENKNIKELARTKDGCITSLHLYKTTELNHRFLHYNKALKELYAPKLKKMGRDCFFSNTAMKKLYVPELEIMLDRCFNANTILTELNAPKLKKMCGGCFARAGSIKQIYIPELEEMGGTCFMQNEELTELNAPKLKKIGNGSFVYNAKLKKLYVPELEEISTNVLANAKHLTELNAPKLKKMGGGCFQYNRLMKKVYIPELEMMGVACFSKTLLIKDFYAPKLKKMGVACFSKTLLIKDFYAPELKITKFTPECIKRKVKLATFKNAIKGMLHLPQNNLGKKDIEKDM